MESQYFITKDENGNYVIANSESGEKLCGINCSVDDPCKNCDKCIRPVPGPVPVPVPVPGPVAVPGPVPVPVPGPITANPVMLAKFRNALKNVDTAPSTRKFMFVDEKGALTTTSIVLISLGVLCVFLIMYFLFKKYKKHREFKRSVGKGYDMFGEDEPSVFYNDDVDTFTDDVEEY